MAARCSTTGRFRAESPPRDWAAVQQRHGYPTFSFFSPPTPQKKNARVNPSLSGAPWVNTCDLLIGADRYYGVIFAAKGGSTLILGIRRLL